MTYDEYKKLVNEWKTSDSISRRNVIENELFKEACVVLKKLNKLYAKYEKDFVNDDEYQEERGSLSPCNEGFNEYVYYIRYYDHWQYGGECDIIIAIPMSCLDKKNRDDRESLLKYERIELLENKIKSGKESIEIQMQSINEMKEELNRLLDTGEKQ